MFQCLGSGIIHLNKRVEAVVVNLGRIDGVDHETRELLGNILGLLEIIKKDIKVIKQDIYVMNLREDGPSPLNKGYDETRQQIKQMNESKSNCPPVSDQLKMSRLR